MRIKQALGKLDLPEDFAAVLSEQAFEPLAVSRMIVAQARTEHLALMTHERRSADTTSASCWSSVRL